MKRSGLRQCMLTAVAAGLMTGCTPETETAPDPVWVSQSVSFTQRTEVVSNPIPTSGAQPQRVEADFNMDGLRDLALLRKGGTTAPDAVEIYIRKPPERDASAADPTAAYYKAGAIKGTEMGRITGVLTRKTNEFTDLLVVVSVPARENMIIHYRNDGSGFEEVDGL